MGYRTRGATAEPTLSELLREYIDASPKTQREIAAEIGYDHPNVISMLKQGHMKLPLDKAPAMAAALDVDKATLLNDVLREYHPKAYIAILQCLGPILTDNEAALVACARDFSGGVVPPLNAELEEGLAALLRPYDKYYRKRRVPRAP